MADLVHPTVFHAASDVPATDQPLRPSDLSIAIAALGVIGLSTAWTVGLPALGVEIPPTTAEAVHGTANTLMQVAAAVALLRGIRLLSGRRRVAWLLITLGPAIGALSAAIWSISVARTGDHPQHPFVDLLFLASLAVTTIGVAALPPTPQRSRRIRWVDSAIVMLAAVTVVWVAPISPSSIADVATITVVGAATALSIAVALGALARCRPDRQGEVGLITGALVTAGFGVLLYLSAGDQYPMTARLSDALFIVSFVLAGAAGLRLASPPATQRRRGTDRRARWIALPEMATIITLVAISLHEQRGDGSLAVSFTVGLIAVGLALLRLAQLGTEQRRLSLLLHDSADRLYREARTDGLTDLGNRLALEEHLTTRLARRARLPEGERSTLVVLFVDVDHFKRFNDALGHTVGDGLLRQVACRLTEAVGARGYRIGGDEFVAVVEGLNPQQTTALAERLVASFDAPVVVGDHEMSSSISVGVTTSDPDDDATAEAVLRRADLALYRAKELGRAGWCAYSPALRRRAEHRTQLRQGLRRAAGLGELEVRFQPMADLRTHATVGVTASLSWDSPDHGVMRCDDVARIAAEGGLLGATIGVLFGQIRRALHVTNRSDDVGYAAPLWVGTRLTLAELVHPATTELIIATVSDPGIDPARLHLDITEDTVVDDAALEVIAGVRQLGVHVTVDRFGTGPSSLLRLSHYPATTIRVDRSFVEGVGRRRDDTAILTAVAGLASDLQLELSADGIDEEFQATYLEGLGFMTGSGRLFGEAVPRGELFDDEGRLRSSSPSLEPGLAR